MKEATKKRFVFYPGHLGDSPHSELPGKRGLLWDRARPVRLVEEPYASSLIRDGGFLPAETLKDAAQALSCTLKVLRELIASGTLVQHRYQPPVEDEQPADKPVEVVIFDIAARSSARAALRKDGAK